MAIVFDRLIVVTRKTPLEELIERLGTREQARFYLEQEAARFGPGGGGPDFAEYVAEDAAYRAARDELLGTIPREVRYQVIERGFLPTFTFSEGELIVVLGPDGLVVNTAKYLAGQPIFAVNPDPTRVEGVLLPFPLRQAVGSGGLLRVLTGHTQRARHITMACARLADGQTQYAVNDLFIGQRTHISARYRLQWGGVSEAQSSSGLIVSTGAGSTGWLRSAAAGASGLAAALRLLPEDAPGAAAAAEQVRFDAEEASLRFCVREPWPSKTTGASLVHGRIRPGEALTIVSQMPQNGVIFSDGVEADYLPFDSGAVARIEVAEKRVHLLLPDQ